MKRNDAASLGLVKYNTGKPCTKGHLSDRYTSSGMCITCLSSHRDKFQRARNDANHKLATGQVQVPVWCARHLVPVYKNVAAVLAGGDHGVINDLISIIETMAGTGALRPVYPPELKPSDIERYVKLNAEREITNADDLDIIDAFDPVGDAHVTAVFMNGHWYDTRDIEQLFPLDSLAIAYPITPPEHLLPKTMKGKIK